MARVMPRSNSVNVSHALHCTLGADTLVDLVDVRLILPVPARCARVRRRRTHIWRELPLGILHLRIPVIPFRTVAVVSEDLQRSILAILNSFVVLLPQLLVLVSGFGLLSLHPHPSNFFLVAFGHYSPPSSTLAIILRQVSYQCVSPSGSLRIAECVICSSICPSANPASAAASLR